MLKRPVQVYSFSRQRFNIIQTISQPAVVAFMLEQLQPMPGQKIMDIGSGSGWGRDTGVDGVLMNYPLLVSGGSIAFGGDDDPKKGSKGSRSFVANKGNTVYIGVVHSATVAESARVMKSMGMDNALNLDNGGSTALWSGGYKVGPGRALPNAIIFIK